MGSGGVATAVWRERRAPPQPSPPPQLTYVPASGWIASVLGRLFALLSLILHPACWELLTSLPMQQWPPNRTSHRDNITFRCVSICAWALADGQGFATEACCPPADSPLGTRTHVRNGSPFSTSVTSVSRRSRSRTWRQFASAHAGRQAYSAIGHAHTVSGNTMLWWAAGGLCTSGSLDTHIRTARHAHVSFLAGSGLQNSTAQLVWHAEAADQNARSGRPKRCLDRPLCCPGVPVWSSHAARVASKSRGPRCCSSRAR
jgi:hypothetical protein